MANNSPTSQASQANVASGGGIALAEPGVIHLPKPEAPPAINMEGLHVVFDGVLAFLALVLAFLLGSFATSANDSDLWMHLATGRMIAQGEYSFGVDPYAFTTEAQAGRPATPWINHQWLLSLVLYGVYSVMGGAGLVVFKAAALTLLAFFLLRMRSSSQSRAWAVLSMALAMLALSTRGHLQPATFSAVLLGVFLYLLYRGGAMGQLAPGQSPCQRALIGAPLLMVLWVNVDGWFVLGPITVGLLWAGAGLGLLAGMKNPLPGKTWAALFFATLGACLLNPHHVRAFTLNGCPELAYLVSQTLSFIGLEGPDWLLAGGRALQHLERLDATAILGSPLSREYVNSVTQGLYVGLAFFLLVPFSLVTFLVLAGAAKQADAPGFPVGRLLVWLFFVALGLALSRLGPLFAVVGGAIAIRNLDEWLTWRAVPAGPLNPLQYTMERSLRWVGLALLGVLLFLAWPGWLHQPFGKFDSPRRVAWRADPDPSWERAALRLAQLRTARPANVQAAQPNLHVFNFSPDLAHYCAWFAPGVKCYFDGRYSLFADHVDQFAAIHAHFQSQSQAKAKVDWEKTFKDYDIEHLALTGFKDAAANQLVRRLWTDPAHWRQEYGDGHTLVFARGRDPEPLSKKLNAQAFGVVPEKDRAPIDGGFPAIGDRSVWDQYVVGTPPQSLASKQSVMYAFHHGEISALFHRQRFVLLHGAWLSYNLGYFAQFGLGPTASPLPILTGNPIQTRFEAVAAQRLPDLGPPALPILAVRQARIAVRDNPYHFTSYLALSNAYKALANPYPRMGQEDYWLLNMGLPADQSMRADLRKIQSIAAVFAYVELNPQAADAHENLGDLYLQQHFLDSALKHYKDALKYFDEKRGERGQDRADRRSNLEARVKTLEREVGKRRKDFEGKGAAMADLERCDLALFKPYVFVDPNNRRQVDQRGMGLAEEAFGILKKIKPKFLTGKEARQVLNMQIYLMLNQGRIAEVQESMTTLQETLGPDQYRFRAFLAGAVGDYRALDEAIENMEKLLIIDKILPNIQDSGFSALMASGLGQLPMSVSATQAVMFINPLLRTAEKYDEQVQQWCEHRALRGIMALEQGDTAKAARFLDEALTKYKRPFTDRILAERYARLLVEQLKKAE